VIDLSARKDDDIRDLTDFFGSSIFSEEYRGDLTGIEEFLQQLKPNVGHQSSEEQAWCTIVRGIFAILKGNMAEAYQFLDKLAHIPDLHPRWQVRHAFYMGLWHGLRRYLRVIRFSPEFGGPGPSLHTKEWKTLEHLNFSISCCQHLENRLSPLEVHEAQVLFFLWVAPSFL
jgi:hypothetical protein